MWSISLLAVSGDEHDPKAPGLRTCLLEELRYIRREHVLRHERECLRSVFVERQEACDPLERHRLVQLGDPILDYVREQGLGAKHARHAPVLQNREERKGLAAHSLHGGQHGIRKRRGVDVARPNAQVNGSRYALNAIDRGLDGLHHPNARYNRIVAAHALVVLKICPEWRTRAFCTTPRTRSSYLLSIASTSARSLSPTRSASFPRHFPTQHPPRVSKIIGRI